MSLNLTVLASTSIKRKKPWPKFAWLGKEQGSLYLLDNQRVSQLYLPSGKTKKKIPSLQPFLVDVQVLNSSPNGQYLAGALKSGKVFVWHKESESLHTTPLLDKIRNVLGSKSRPAYLFVSNCGTKVLLLSGYNQLFLWETGMGHSSLVQGEPFTGTWLQIHSGDYTLPGNKDKEAAVEGIFYDDQVSGLCALVSWVFNKEDKIHITTLQLHWSQTAGNYGMEPTLGGTSGGDPPEYHNGRSLPFSAKWRTFVHPLHGLIPATRVLKSSKAYVSSFSSDGQVLAVAMNQKFAADCRMMFYSTASSSVAIINDLKGCGATTLGNTKPSGRVWWIADMSWTRDSLLVIAITRCGFLAICTKLGEPVIISTAGCSVDMGPNLYLPIHPRIYFKKTNVNGHADSSMSSSSEADVLHQRFSVAVHPSLPVILISDGYLVTVMQLPGNASYKRLMMSFMADVTRLIPEVELGLQSATLSRSSSISRINIFQSEPNLSRGQPSEEVSENTASSTSSNFQGYGIASGDQGIAFMGIDTPVVTKQNTPSAEVLDRAASLLQAQHVSLKALAMATSAGPNWNKDMNDAMNNVIRGVAKLFAVLLRSQESLEVSLMESLKMLPRSMRNFEPSQESLNLNTQTLEEGFTYFRMAMELFQWDSTNRNAFSWAIRLVHWVIKEVIIFKQCSDTVKISSSVQFLEFSERLLSAIYSWNLSSRMVGRTGNVTVDSFSPTKSMGMDSKYGNGEKEEVSENGDGNSQIKEPPIPPGQPSQIARDLAGPWLLLYNYTAQSCKRPKRRPGSGDRPHHGSEPDLRGSQAELTKNLCDIQKKLQDIGVKIPTMPVPTADYPTGITSFIEPTHDETGSMRIAAPGMSSTESLNDSMFGRKRASRMQQPVKQSTPIRLQRGSSLECLEKDISLIGKPTLLQSPAKIEATKEYDSRTLLSILYHNLQQYDLRSAVELAYSLMEPSVSIDEVATTLSDLFVPLTSGSHVAAGQDFSTSQILSVLLQSYPVVRVADKSGISVVQTLGRFMAAYFSDLPLYIFPSYRPEVLPPFHFGEGGHYNGPSEESFELAHGPEVEHLEREKISTAIREQGLSDLWSANSALDLMLVSGLIGEAAWLSKNLGDWKNSFLLSVAQISFSSVFPPATNPATLPSVLHNQPDDINPEQIVLSRLQPVFHSPELTLPNIHKIDVEVSEDASAPTKDRLMKEEPNPGKLEAEIDGKLVTNISRILQAGVVAGLDVAPVLMWKLLHDLLGLVSQLDWIVPEGLYLPSPPLFCPQPPSAQTEFLLPRVYRERQLRSEAANVVQKILTLLHASRCMAPCTQWYVEQLVSANEKWSGIPRDDPACGLPQSLLAQSEMGTTFAAAEQEVLKASRKSSPKSKGKSSPPREGGTTDKDSIDKSQTSDISPSVAVMLACFQQFCVVMWLLHARDKMSLCARKYRRSRHETAGNTEVEVSVDGLCWETLQWTLRLLPFSSLLGASAQIYDTLLTLLSEMQPNIATAEIAAQHFRNPDLIPTTAGKAKFRRLMTQFRAISLREAGSIEEGNPEEPLSVFYREKCLQWEEELEERRQLYGDVIEEIFHRTDSEVDYPPSNQQLCFSTSRDLPRVGAIIFETTPAYIHFLDTFAMIVVSKTVSQFNSQSTSSSIPLLLSYANVFTVSEAKALKDFRHKANADKAKKLTVESGLFRSQSFADIRSSRPKVRFSVGHRVPFPDEPTDIRRCSSLNDITKVSSSSGIVVLGTEIIDLLPRLTWLSGWSSEGTSLPSINLGTQALGVAEGHPVMRVHVKLQLLVNSLWLMKNVYGPWEMDEKVNPDFLKPVPRPVFSSALERDFQVPPDPEPSTLQPSSPLCSKGWASGKLLRRVSSDTDIPRILVESPTTEEDDETRQWARKARKGKDKVWAPGLYFSDPDSPLMSRIRRDESDSSLGKRARKKTKSTRRNLKLIEQKQEKEDAVEDTDLPEDILKAGSLPDLQESHLTTEGLPEDILKADLPDLHESYLTTEDGDIPVALQPSSSVKKVTGSFPVPSPKTRKKQSHPSSAPCTQRSSKAQIILHDLGTSEEAETPVTSTFDSPVVAPPKVQQDSENQIGATVEHSTNASQPIDLQNSKNTPMEQQRSYRPHDISAPFAGERTAYGGVELLLVLRSSGQEQQMNPSLDSGIPILKLSTVSSEYEPSYSTTRSSVQKNPENESKDTGSQTETPDLRTSSAQANPIKEPVIPSVRTRGTSTASQYVDMQHNGNRDAVCQADVYEFSNNTASTNYGQLAETKDVITAFSQQLKQGIRSDETDRVRQAWPAQSMLDNKPPQIPLLQLQQKHSSENKSTYATEPLVFRLLTNTQSQMTEQPSLPLLHIPAHSFTYQPDPRKVRLFEIPKTSRDLPLLQMPEAARNDRPDLSKIKFLEVTPRNGPGVLLQRGAIRPASNAIPSFRFPDQVDGYPQPLLKIPAKEPRVPDISKVIFANEPRPAAGWPLLHLPEKKEPPKLVSGKTLAAFEKKKRKRQESPRHSALEKEYLRPKRTSVQSRNDWDKPVKEEESGRYTVSRQRRRERQDKCDEPPDDATFHVEPKARPKVPLRAKKVVVQPAKREKRSDPPSAVSTSRQIMQKEAQNQAARTGQRRVELKDEGLSDESELELSVISEDFALSDEEQMYYHPQMTPKVTNRQVDEYCRELEERVKEQFNRELEARVKEQLDQEVKERLERKMERELRENERERVAQMHSVDVDISPPWDDGAVSKPTGTSSGRVGENVGTQLKKRQKSPPPRPVPRKRSSTIEKSAYVRLEIGSGVTRSQIGVQVEMDELERVDITKTDRAVVDFSKRICKASIAAQTEPEYLAEEVQSHAPTLPPDIFLGLTFSKSAETEDQEVGIDAPSVLPVTSKEPKEIAVATGNARHFLSVADIENEEWAKIQSGPSATTEHKRGEDGLDTRLEEMEENQHVASDIEEDVSVHESAVDTLSPDVRHRRQQKYDSLTTELMDSIDMPAQRSYPLPATTQTNIDARRISKQRITTSLLEMTEQLSAIEQITQNMDREFQSSNMLLRAIENIGDVMTPSREAFAADSPHSARRTPIRNLQSSGRGSAAGVRNIAPWRRDPPGSQKPQKHFLNGKEGDVEDTNGEGMDVAELDGTNDMEVTTDDKDLQDGDKGHQENYDHEQASVLEEYADTHAQESTDEDALDMTPTSDNQHMIGENKSRGLRPSHDSLTNHRSTKHPDVSSSAVSKPTSSSSFQDALEAIKLTPEKLKQIFNVDRKATRQASEYPPEKRKELKEWMAGKRFQRHAEWQSQVEELRSAEHKPFISTSEGPSTMKKIKLAEKEREAKRRNREQGHIDERLKDASSLISEMLAEQVPKANTLSNISYTAPKSKTKAVREPKSRVNDRYNTKPATKQKSKPPKYTKKTTATRSKQARSSQDSAIMDAVDSEILAPTQRHDVQEKDYEIYETGSSRLGKPFSEDRPLTSSPLYTTRQAIDNRSSAGHFFDVPDHDLNEYALGGIEDVRPVSPSGPDFITVKTYRMHEKDKVRRSRELERELELECARMRYDSQRVVYPDTFGENFSVDIDKLLDEITDGSTMDEDRFQDIQSMLSDDSELKELLADVIGIPMPRDKTGSHVTTDVISRGGNRAALGTKTMTISKGARGNAAKFDFKSVQRKPPNGASVPQCGRDKSTSRNLRPQPTPQLTGLHPAGGQQSAYRSQPQSSSRAFNPSRGLGSTVRLARGAASRREPTSREKQGKRDEKSARESEEPIFDVDDVSPWDTGDSLKMSDDVAQLLAEAKQAVGDDFSESSGSIMSNIDWDAVDRIMNNI